MMIYVKLSVGNIVVDSHSTVFVFIYPSPLSLRESNPKIVDTSSNWGIYHQLIQCLVVKSVLLTWGRVFL